MQFIVNKTITQSIAVEADSPEAAGAAVKAGQGNPMSYNESFSVQPRPRQGQITSAPPHLGFARQIPERPQPMGTLPPVIG